MPPQVRSLWPAVTPVEMKAAQARALWAGRADLPLYQRRHWALRWVRAEWSPAAREDLAGAVPLS